MLSVDFTAYPPVNRCAVLIVAVQLVLLIPNEVTDQLAVEAAQLGFASRLGI